MTWTTVNKNLASVIFLNELIKKEVYLFKSIFYNYSIDEGKNKKFFATEVKQQNRAKNTPLVCLFKTQLLYATCLKSFTWTTIALVKLTLWSHIQILAQCTSRIDPV